MKMKTLLAVACSVLVLLSSPAQAETKTFLAGQEEARNDIKAGTLKYMLYGQPQAHDQVFAKVLKNDYKITLEIVGGCTVSQEARERAEGYNQTILTHLKETFKRDVIKEAEEKSRKQWPQGHGKAAAFGSKHPLANDLC